MLREEKNILERRVYTPPLRHRYARHLPQMGRQEGQQNAKASN